MSDIVLAYVPVIHKGYLELLKKTETFFGVLDREVVAGIQSLERDVRALTAIEAVRALVGLVSPYLSVRVVNKNYLKHTLRKRASEGKIRIIMPDEDVSRYVLEEYLSGIEIEFYPVFLRWDMGAVKSREKPLNHRSISAEEFGHALVEAGYKEAERSPDWWRQIGAVLFRDGEVLLSAHNTHMPTEYSNHIDGDPRINFDAGEETETTKASHAERTLFAEALARGMMVSGTSIYVTTFPCPTCAWFIAKAGIREVYYTEGYSCLEADKILKSYDVDIVHVEV